MLTVIYLLKEKEVKMENNLIAQASENWFKKNNLTYQELSNIGDAHVLLEDIIDDLKNTLEKYIN